MTQSGQSGAAYDDWHEGLSVDFDADTPWHRLLQRHINPEHLRAKRVLEIGCGRGGFSCWLARSSYAPKKINAVDYSDVAVAKAREFASQQGIANVEWSTGDIQAIAFPDGTFDAVFSCETIEHVPNPSKAVQELGRVLAPGGTLYLTSPNYLGPLGLYRGYLRLRGRHFTEAGQPINQFTTLPSTVAWVRRAGLEVVETDGVGHYLTLPGRAPIPVPQLDVPVMKWVALHSIVVARKP